MAARNNKVVIDGQRKAALRSVDTANYEFTGLKRESEWRTFKQKGYVLVTLRALEGATLHLEQLNGQLPEVGQIIPKALFKGRSGVFKGGDQMAQHLDSIKVNAKNGRAAVKALNQIKAAIL